jgi:two-component system, OmpR family, response regulator
VKTGTQILCLQSGTGVPSGAEVIVTRVLVVEDAPKLLGILIRRLQDEGYAVDGAASGTDAVRQALLTAYDAIVLDLRLPDIDGIEVCRRLRAAERWSPILMLTARDGLGDRVHGLDAGADDYLIKPFAFPELFARVRALARRGSSARPAEVVVGDLALDPASRVVTCRGDVIDLTVKEFALLEVFMRHPGVVLGRARLIEHVWDHTYQGDSNIIDVHIRNLRSKIDHRDRQRTLQTVRGIGYRLCDDATATAPHA